ncbi:hypothetical protein WA026_022992 [Henosepilachna vigintioctopunctata]|uniref:Uncharacterized protein n=1 Tax=Henosepilachna vigintioctopunctata TaxID=420089 RepID=A0AAW1UGI8_9CUCU
MTQVSNVEKDNESGSCHAQAFQFMEINLKFEKVNAENILLKELLREVQEKNKILTENNNLLVQRICDIDKKNAQKRANDKQSNDSTTHDSRPVRSDNIGSSLHDIAPLRMKSDRDGTTSLNYGPSRQKHRSGTETEQIEPQSNVNVRTQMQKHGVSNNDVNVNVTNVNEKAKEIAKNVHDFFENSESDITENRINRNEWQTVTRAKMRTKRPECIVSVGPKTNNRSAKLKAVSKKKWLYIGKISENDVPEEAIRDYPREIDGYESIEIKKLVTKGRNSAFSIGVPTIKSSTR